jgi:hypothetical protein
VKAVGRWLCVGAFPILVASAFFTPQLLTRSLPLEASLSTESPVVPASQVQDGSGPAQTRDNPGESTAAIDGFTDLYGNEVTDAIATYTFDQAGSLYELHSPQTELPRLGIPKS